MTPAGDAKGVADHIDCGGTIKIKRFRGLLPKAEIVVGHTKE